MLHCKQLEDYAAIVSGDNFEDMTVYPVYNLAELTAEVIRLNEEEYDCQGVIYEDGKPVYLITEQGYLIEW